MSDDLLRSARQFLAELDASEAYLRHLACTALPYSGVIAIERRAGRRCAELLASLGGSAFDLDLGDDATDELLSGAVRPRATAAAVAAAGVAAAGAVLGAPELVGAGDPFDDGPEGAADEVVDLLSEEDEPTGISAEVPQKDQAPRPTEPVATQADDDDEDTSDADTSQGRSPVKATSGGDVSFVSFEAGDQDEPEVLKYDDDGNVIEGDTDRPGVTPSVLSDDPFAGLVSFDDDTGEDDQDATIIAPREVASEGLGDVGRDALDTIGQSSESVIEGLGQHDDLSELELELEELELDHESAHVETFDLMPDLTEEEGDDDEDVTMVTPVPEVTEDEPSSSEVVIERKAQAKARPSARVTAGLYGNPNVPTIRESTDPRPRAAAIQLNTGGTGGKVMGLEEEAEPIEIGSAEDDEAFDEVPGGSGFSVSLEQYEDDDDEYEDEEEEEDEEVIEPALPVAPPPPTQAELAALFSQAQQAAAGGDLQTGTDLFSDVIDLDPDHVDAHVGRGRLYLDLGDYSRAMSDFMVAEEIEQTNPEPQIAIGDLYFARKDYRKAIDYFNAALEMSPNHAMAFCRRGISHYYRKNYKQALEDLLRAQKLNADIPNIQTYVSMAKKKARK